MITQSELKDVLNYDQDTGIFTWKKRTGSRAAVGNIAGSLRKDEYSRIEISKKKYLSHRLAWLYIYGKFPNDDIDHINGNKSDNRIINLREATCNQNNCNRNIQKNNKSGVKGIYKHNQYEKWVAAIRINKKRIYLGVFDNLELAKLVISKARNEYHKEYANHG
jgi:hypothetical protein